MKNIFIKNYLKNNILKSTSSASHDCLQKTDIYQPIGITLECVRDNNTYDDTNLACEENEFKIIDSMNNKIECGKCK